MSNLELLTEIEKNVYNLMLENQRISSGKISEMLNISLSDTKTTQNTIYKKLDILGKTEIRNYEKKNVRYKLKEESELVRKADMKRYFFLRDNLGYNSYKATKNMSKVRFLAAVAKHEEQNNVKLCINL